MAVASLTTQAFDSNLVLDPTGKGHPFRTAANASTSALVQGDGSVQVKPPTGPTGTLRVTAGGPAYGQSILSFESNGGVSITGGVTVPLGTIPAGKNFYLTDISIVPDFANTNSALFQITVNNIVLWESYASNTSAVELAGLESQEVVTTGGVLRLVCPNITGNISYDMSGVLM